MFTPSPREESQSEALTQLTDTCLHHRCWLVTFLNHSDGFVSPQLTIEMVNLFVFIEETLSNIYEADITEYQLCAKHHVKPWKK